MSNKRKEQPSESVSIGKRPATGTRSSNRWKADGKTLLYKICRAEKARSKAACFDLDGTLVKTKGNTPFPRTAEDWVLFNDMVVKKLQDLYADDFKLVIFSNQGGIKSSLDGLMATKIKSRIDQILQKVEVPVDVYLSTSKDSFRKPEAGMWDYFLGKSQKDDIEKDQSFFVGDAAGRTGDFSDSDLKFAENIGLRFFTPEDFFKQSEDTE